MERLERWMWFLLDNGPSILTIVFATVVIAQAQTAQVPDTAVILQWILAILGLLAVSELIERMRRLRKIEETTEKTLRAIEGKVGERSKAEDFFVKSLPPLRPYLEQAMLVRMSGVALQRTIRDNRDVLLHRLEEGATIQVAIVNPDGAAAKRIGEANPVLTWQGLQNYTSVTLHNLRLLNGSPMQNGQIELRFIEEEPKFNIIAIDDDKDHGMIFVEFFPQRWTSGVRPRMELTARRDGYWFDYFQKQFDDLWKDYQTVDLQDEARQ